MKRLFGLLLAWAVIATPGAHGAGLVVVDEAHWFPPGARPPVFPPPDLRHPPHAPRRVYAPLEVRELNAQVTIEGQLARVSIEQEFHNPNPHRMEGHFLFPRPRGAQLSKFTLEINGRPVEAELLPADQARKIYEDIVRKLKDPALLEYASDDVFKVRLFPIEPNQSRRVGIHYEQLLTPDAGLNEFRLPLRSGQFSAKAVPRINVDIRITTRQPLKTVYCSTHDVAIRHETDCRAHLRFSAEETLPENDLQLFFASEREPIGVQLLAHRDGDDPGAFLLLLSPGMPVDEGEVVPKDVVFVVDTSGSMAGAKLQQASRAMRFCVESLNPKDRFEVVRFSTDSEPLFGRLTKAGNAPKARADQFLKTFKALGGTAIDQALHAALRLNPQERGRPFVIVFLTDGRPTVGEVDEAKIVANVKHENEAMTRIFCFGIGHDVNTHLLDKITELTRSSSQYVLPEEDLEVKISNFFARINDPVLVNPTLEWGAGVRISQVHPTQLPDLFRGDQVIVAGRYTGSGGTTVRLVGESRQGSQAHDYQVRFPKRARKHDFVPRLWATRRVGYLLDEIRLRGESAELKDEVSRLARRYGIVTPYTALLIVEDEATRGLSVNLQSLPTLQQDQQTRLTAEAEVSRMVSQRYGLSAVSRARSESALKAARAPSSAIQVSRREAQRSFAAEPDSGISRGRTSTSARPPQAMTLDSVGQQIRYVDGRNFSWSTDRWLDTLVQQQAPDTRRQRLQFGSESYWQLAREYPEVRRWLALGPQVDFVWKGTIVEIRE